MAELPERAQVVIVGGGIVGCSVAYHLAKRGITDVVLIEQGTLTSGTTWHAAGLVAQLRSSFNLTRLARYSAELYETLEAETGQATGFRRPGAITVADTEDRWQELLRAKGMAACAGVEVHEMSLDEVSEKVPLADVDELVGALWIPGDGVTSPVDTTMALAKGAKAGGVRMVEGVAVTDVKVVDGRATGVVTERGEVEAETVVLATGMWTRHLAAKIGVNVPLQACEHFYVVTEPLEGVYPGMPTLRDPGGFTYFKEETGKIMAGFFEPRGKVWSLEGVPRDFSFGTLPEDWEHVGPVFERAARRMPVLAECGLQLFFNGPEAFTPDGVYYLGEAPEVDGVFVAAGFNSVGIQSAGGAGWVLADWIADRLPPMDLCSVDIRRAFAFQSDDTYLAERIPESLGLLYAMHWPHRQYESARGIRFSPFHERLDQARAVWGELAGWERPNWFATGDTERVYRYSFGKQNWHELCGEECMAVRTAVGLFDLTSYARWIVEGPDALEVLDTMSANRIDVAVGKAVYTQWCNRRGGIEADLTVTRLGQQRFLVVTAPASATRDMAWLRRACKGRAVAITDVTNDISALGVMGPSSRALLQSLGAHEMGNDQFAFGTARHIDLAGIEVLAMRMTYVGELGWELYIPTAYALAVYDAIVSAGRDLGLRHCGFHALNSLRLEAGYRHWGHDIADEDTPLEAGLGFAVAWDKPSDFVGREALELQRHEVRSKRLLQFRIEDPDVMAYHDEPLFRDGVMVGRLTSAMWSYTEDRCLGMGYANSPEAIDQGWLDSGNWQIEVAGARVDATPSIRSFYDPRNQRVRM